MKTTRLMVPTVLLLFVLGSFAAPTFGDSLTLSGNANDVGGPINCTVTVSHGPETVICASTLGIAVATASGNLAAGTFGALSTVNTSVAPPLSGSAGSTATIVYDFTVTGTSSGVADFNVGIASGKLVGVGAQAAQNATLFSQTPSTEFIVGGVVQPALINLGNGSTDFVVETNIVNGVALLQLILQVNASCALACSSTGDFLDPFGIAGASVFDSNGNLVSGATLVSDSGFNPSAAPVLTPEPSSLVLLGAAFVGLVGFSFKKAIRS